MLLITLFSDEYRYGFQGQETDDEVKGEGNSYGYEARMYDSRVGRWLSRDPLEMEYPEWSPYVAMADNPIFYIDLGGEKFVHPYDGLIESQQKVVNDKKIIYENMIKSYANKKGITSKRKIKKAGELSGYSDASKQLNKLTKKKSIIEGYLKTFELSSPEDYNFLENLVDDRGNEVIIEINLLDGFNSTNNNNAASTIPQNLGIVPILENDKEIGVKMVNVEDDIEVDFEVKMYEKYISGSEFDANYVQTNIISSGWDYGSLMNECGDIDYIFTQIETREDIDLWKNSAGGSSDLYYSTEGAGEYSRQYESDHVKQKTDYEKGN